MDLEGMREIERKNVSVMRFLKCAFLQDESGKNIEGKLENVLRTNCDFRLEPHEDLEFVVCGEELKTNGTRQCSNYDFFCLHRLHYSHARQVTNK